MKQCNRCTQVKSVQEFHKNKAASDGIKSVCKECAGSAKKEFSKEYYRNRSLVGRYGITLQEYNEMLIDQDYSCKVCKVHEKYNDCGRQLAVDHCHDTGKVRGLLCQKCNVGLGLFRDNISFLAEAIKYLEDNR